MLNPKKRFELIGLSIGLIALAAIIFTIIREGKDSAPAATEFANRTPSEYVEHSAEAPISTDSRWTVTSELNELDNTKKIAVSTGDVVIRCTPKVEGYIIPTLTNLGHQLEANGDYEQVVRYRIDNGSVQSSTWSVSTSFDSLFFPPAVLRKLRKGKMLVVEYKPDYVVPQTETFDLTGLESALRKAGCTKLLN